MSQTLNYDWSPTPVVAGGRVEHCGSTPTHTESRPAPWGRTGDTDKRRDVRGVQEGTHLWPTRPRARRSVGRTGDVEGGLRGGTAARDSGTSTDLFPHFYYHPHPKPLFKGLTIECLCRLREHKKDPRFRVPLPSSWVSLDVPHLDTSTLNTRIFRKT